MLITNKFFPLATLLLVLAGPSMAATAAMVDMQVTCKGSDSFHELSSLDKIVLANAIQDSFNKIRGEDDGELSNVQVNGSHEVGASSLSGVMNFYERMTPDEHDIVMEGIKQQLWEANLVEILKETSRPAFEDLQHCNIQSKLRLGLGNDETPEDDTIVTAKVKVYVKCNKVNPQKLSIPELMFMGRVIEDSYNKVHESENDDTRAVDIHYGDSMEMSLEDNLSTSQWKPWALSLICRYCKRREVILSLLSQDQDIIMWENEVVSGLVGSGSQAFANVNKCSITMKLANADAPVVSAEETIKKCGVRACTENV